MKGRELATKVTEGANTLATLLCAGSVASLRKQGTSREIDALVSQALATYGPAFRAMKKLVRGAKDVEPVLARLETLLRAGVDYGSAEEVAALRASLRELLGNVGFDLPRQAGPGVVCELHGKVCPEMPAA